MSIELLLMIVSGIGMAGMLVHGHMGKVKGLRTRLHGISEKGDPVIASLEGSAAHIASKLTLKNFVLALNQAFVFVARIFIKIFREAHDILHGIVDKASRKTEDLSRSGAASFYLKKIKEGKEEASAEPRE